MENGNVIANNNSEPVLKTLQEKQLDLEIEIKDLTLEIETDKSEISRFNTEKLALEKEKPRVLLFFGGDRSESDIEKDKEENRKNIEEKENLIKENEKKLKELNEELKKTVNEINTEYNRQVQNLSNEKKILEKQEKDSKKQNEDILKSFKEENEKLKKTIEEQEKIIEEKDGEQDDQEDDEEKTLSDEELRDLAVETMNYFNSIPSLVKRNGRHYDTKRDIEKMEDFLLENDLESIQDVKEQTDQVLRKVLSYYDDGDYENKDTGELIEELDAKNNNLLERIRKNDEEAIEKYQNILNNINNEISRTNIFVKILMFFGYDYGNLKTRELIVKERIRQKKKDILRNERKAMREKEKYEKEIKDSLGYKLKQEQNELNSSLYETYSGFDINNIQPNTSLEEKQKKEGISLTD